MVKENCASKEERAQLNQSVTIDRKRLLPKGSNLDKKTSTK